VHRGVSASREDSSWNIEGMAFHTAIQNPLKRAGKLLRDLFIQALILGESPTLLARSSGRQLNSISLVNTLIYHSLVVCIKIGISQFNSQ